MLLASEDIKQKQNERTAASLFPPVSLQRQVVCLLLVFSKQSDNILISTKLLYGLTSDHTAILCKLDVSVPEQKPETFSYRCLRKIDTGAFKQDLSHAVSPVSSISDYSNHFCSVLNKHAPLCRCTVRTSVTECIVYMFWAMTI